jgi:hypothetical protein
VGFSLAWVAVRGKDRDAVLRELGLRGTGEEDDVGEAEVCGLKLAGGWYVLFMNDWGEAAGLKDEAALARLTKGAEAVYCGIEEHAMSFAASHWRDGAMAWRVEHSAEKGERHLDVSGKPPPEFAGIRDRRMKEQDAGGADFVAEIPVDLAELVTGFRHDRGPPEPFEVLEATPERKAPAGRRGCLLALAAALLGLR